MKIARIVVVELSLISLACGRCETTTVVVENEPSLMKMAQDIVSMCGDTLSDQIASIGFDAGSLSYPVVGQCDMPVIETHERDRTIKVSRKFWENASHSDRMFLLCHEIGHCQYGLGHDDSIIMNENTPFGVLDLETVKELFMKRVCPEQLK